MRNKIASSALAMIVGSVTPNTASAQGYSVDCAILLCLSGGWPASAPCAHARTVFIRRITPWPIEPPLQIWRCPMSAAYHDDSAASSFDRLTEATFRGQLFQRSIPTDSLAIVSADPLNQSNLAIPQDFGRVSDSNSSLPDGFTVQLAQAVGTGADIDLSDPVFDFIRSIRVLHVRLSQTQGGGPNDNHCSRADDVRIGTYGTQGDFRWDQGGYSDLPLAFDGDDGFNTSSCPNLYLRSVFIEWRDYEGTYGYEQVDY